MMMSKALVGVLIGVGATVVAPLSPHGGPRTRDGALGLPACVRRGPLRIAPVNAERSGSAVALARFGDHTIAYVADEDDKNIHAFDVDTQRELSTTPTRGIPAQLIVTQDGRVVVALRDQAQVEVLEPGATSDAPLASRCTIGTPDEPLALAFTPDDSTLLVSTGWGHELVAYVGDTLARKFSRSLPREPRSVLVSDDGNHAFVAHAVGGKMSVVDLTGDVHAVSAIDVGEQGDLSTPARIALVPRTRQFDSDGNEKKSKPLTEASPRSACQGFALAKTVAPQGRILAPQVLVDTGDKEQLSQGYGSADQLPTEVPAVAVIDDQAREPLVASLTVAARPEGGNFRFSRNERHDCMLPRASAIDPGAGLLLVTCLGIDSVIAYDASSANPASAEVHRWEVAAGPTGIAIDASRRRTVVWSQFDRTISVLQLGEVGAAVSDERPVQIALSRLPASPTTQDVVLGRKLFHTGMAADGRACASCHPDGRDDALTWATPEGPRQTPSLAGRLEGTAPYAWHGSGATVEAHLDQTFNRLQASAPPQRSMDALVAYAMTMAPPARATTSGSFAVLARGREIFHSSEAACSSCHGVDGQSPDRMVHDLGIDPSPSGPATAATTVATFDTPSLKYIGGTAPYLHDGRYGSLKDLLAATDGKMGQTSHLSNGDLNALETYLRSL